MMLEHKKIQNLSDFYRVGEAQGKGSIFFIVLMIIPKKLGNFYMTIMMLQGKCGVIIEGKIPNPTRGNLALLRNDGNDFQLGMGFIMCSLKKWLPRMNRSQNENVAASIYDSLEELRRSGKKQKICSRNTYIKFMCWLYYKFERIVKPAGTGTTSQRSCICRFSQQL